MCRTLIIALVATAPFVASATPPSKAPIEKDLEKLVSLFSDGWAKGYPQYRHIDFGDVFGEGRQDAVAVFNIEGFDGGNDDHQHLAVWRAVDPDPNLKFRPFRLVAVTQIGGRAWREFDWQTMKIGANSVTLSGKAYGPRDANCCPSVPIRITFHVKNGCISEAN
jgi:hypothetical protein